MDLVSVTVGLPFAPLRAVLAIAQVIQEEAEQELYDPMRVGTELEEIGAARERQELSDEEAAEAEQRTLDRLLG